MKFVLEYETGENCSGRVELLIPDINLPPQEYTENLNRFLLTLNEMNALLHKQGIKATRRIEK